ncbi:integrase DNA-binding domain-containing protein [Enterococcus gallinarum]|nr:integrase DNA-binding domain-containing protein [Enterococcus gallinarum]
MSNVKRKDSKNRNLRTGESQRVLCNSFLQKNAAESAEFCCN